VKPPHEHQMQVKHTFMDFQALQGPPASRTAKSRSLSPASSIGPRCYYVEEQQYLEGFVERMNSLQLSTPACATASSFRENWQFNCGENGERIKGPKRVPLPSFVDTDERHYSQTIDSLPSNFTRTLDSLPSNFGGGKGNSTLDSLPNFTYDTLPNFTCDTLPALSPCGEVDNEDFEDFAYVSEGHKSQVTEKNKSVQVTRLQDLHGGSLPSRIHGGGSTSGVLFMNEGYSGQSPAASSSLRPFVRDFPSLQGDPGLCCDHPQVSERSKAIASVLELQSQRPLTGKDIEKSDVTTLMIRNIPYSVTEEELTNICNTIGFFQSFDFLYVPPSRYTKNKFTNKGYAFINFLAPQVAAQFLTDLNGSKLPGTTSDRHVEVRAAVFQGLPACKEGLSKSIVRQ